MNNSLGSGLSIIDICQELGLSPEVLVALGAVATSYYQTFERPKRSGGRRHIAASQDRLKWMQQTLLKNFFSKVIMPAHVHGCVKGRSIATNARNHLNKDVVLNLDLTNFFGSIDESRVKTVLQERFNCDLDASQILTNLLTYKGSLPQGAPTSPVIANFAALDLDAALMQVCSDAVGADNFAYSRYVDDITISGTSSLIDLLPEISSKIAECGFKDNVQKTKILRQSTRQWVTGLVVNKSLNPPKKLIRRIRQDLYYCHKYGLAPHCEWRGVPVEQFVRQITGSIGYVGMAQPELARAFMYELVTLTRSFGLGPEEIILHQLKSIIDRGRIAIFVYNNTIYRVAPSEIVLSESETVELRAFQLSPEQGWTQFTLLGIKDLQELDDQ